MYEVWRARTIRPLIMRKVEKGHDGWSVGQSRIVSFSVGPSRFRVRQPFSYMAASPGETPKCPTSTTLSHAIVAWCIVGGKLIHRPS